MSEDWSTIRIRGAIALPTPEEAASERLGVVFYRLGAADFPMAETLGAIAGIARLVTSMGPGRNTSKPYEMRVGFKWEDGNSHYWVGFNHVAFGAMFEQALRAAGVKWTQRDRQRLGAKASNKELSIADPEVLEARRQQLLGGRAPRRPTASGGSASMPAAAPEARSTPAEPVVRMGPFERMRAARQELGASEMGQRIRRGRRGRRGQQAEGQ